jgi:hypothetical protein
MTSTAPRVAGHSTTRAPHAPALTAWKLGEVARWAIENAERLAFDRNAGAGTGSRRRTAQRC